MKNNIILFVNRVLPIKRKSDYTTLYNNTYCMNMNRHHTLLHSTSKEKVNLWEYKTAERYLRVISGGQRRLVSKLSCVVRYGLHLCVLDC